MARDTRVCAVCGKKYKCCPNIKDIPGMFQWQRVACSPKCGGVYISRMDASNAAADEQLTISSLLDDDGEEEDEEDEEEE